MGMMLALGARGREFDSPKSPVCVCVCVCADMAQVVARCADNAEVFGSIPNIRIFCLLYLVICVVIFGFIRLYVLFVLVYFNLYRLCSSVGRACGC